MGDEGDGLAVFGLDVDLLVDHGRFLPVVLLIFVCAFNTIARKPQHDKASRRMAGLNRSARIAIVLEVPLAARSGAFSR
jgi:hypothetical protein